MPLDSPYPYPVSAVVHERGEALAATADLRGDVSWHPCVVREVYVYYRHYDNKNEVLSPGIMDDEQDVRAASIITFRPWAPVGRYSMSIAYYIESLQNTRRVVSLFVSRPSFCYAF